MAIELKIRRSAEPPGGLLPREALLAIPRSELVETFDASWRAHVLTRIKAGCRKPRRRGLSPRPNLNSSADSLPTRAERIAIVRAARQPEFRETRHEYVAAGTALVRDLASRLRSGEVVAFGSPSSMTSDARFEIHSSAWTNVRWINFPFTGRDWCLPIGRQHFVELTFHWRHDLKNWREGMHIRRALELMFPTAFANYDRAVSQQRKSRRSNDSATEGRPEEHHLIHWDLTEAFRRGGLELLVLYPPGPDAKFQPVSMDQRNSYRLTDFDIERSMLRLHGLDWCPAVVRFIGILGSDPSEQPGKRLKSPISHVQKVVDFLMAQAASGPKTMPKQGYFELAKELIPGLSKANFHRGWEAFVKDHPEWGKAGRPKSNQPTE